MEVHNGKNRNTLQMVYIVIHAIMNEFRDIIDRIYFLTHDYIMSLIFYTVQSIIVRRGHVSVQNSIFTIILK